MKKILLSVFVASLLAGCATAHQQTEQEKALVGDWLCYTKPTPHDELPFDRIDHFTFNKDQTVVMRGIAKLKVKEGELRYLSQAKAKWKADHNKLSYDFSDRRFSAAHTPQVAKVFQQNPEIQEFDKLFTAPCNCGSHLDVAIDLKAPAKLVIGNSYAKQVSQCRKLNLGEKTKETTLIEKLVREAK